MRELGKIIAASARFSEAVLVVNAYKLIYCALQKWVTSIHRPVLREASHPGLVCRGAGFFKLSALVGENLQ